MIHHDHLCPFRRLYTTNVLCIAILKQEICDLRQITSKKLNYGVRCCCGSGETIFFDRIFQCFISIQEDAIQLNQNQIDIIHNEIEKMNFRGYSSKDSD